jgi:DNA-binding response OmpR family regulator
MASPPTTVLLIDDDAFFLKILSDAFSGSGFLVFTAEDGSQGVKTYLDRKPDVVICDLVMPVMGGVSTCMAIRKIAGDSEPIIAMLTSMFKGSPKILETPEMGARFHIPKSIHPLNVVILIEQLLNRSKNGADSAC